jgi:hypothetical protein
MRRKYRLDDHFRSRLTNVAAGASRRGAEVVGADLVPYRKGVLAYLLARDDLRFVTGHVGCTREIVDEFADVWQFVTVLRDPVSRFVSEYFYNRYKESEHFATRLSFSDYLAAHTSAQTYVTLFSGLPLSAPVDERIEDAVGNVSRFALVGEVERLAEFRARFAQRFGVTLRDTHRNENPAPGYDELKHEADARRADIEALCAADIEFYRRLREKVF